MYMFIKDMKTDTCYIRESIYVHLCSLPRTENTILDMINSRTLLKVVKIEINISYKHMDRRVLSP